MCSRSPREEGAAATTAMRARSRFSCSTARWRNKRHTGINATYVRRVARVRLIHLPRTARLPVVAVVFDIAEPVLLERSRQRHDGRSIPDSTIKAQVVDLHRSLAALQDEGFDDVFLLSAPETVDTVVVERASSRSPVRD